MSGKAYLSFEQIGMSFRRGTATTEVLRDVDLQAAQQPLGHGAPAQ